MDSTSHILKTLRVIPTVQQGGTQTIQQSIYLAHDNPCGVNLLIFQEMGLTQIRYIDLKNLLDAILGSEQMKLLFQSLRLAGDDFINNPLDEQKQNKYLYALGEWAYYGIFNLPIPVLHYPGYRIKFSVYDAAGAIISDSNFPFLQIVSETGGIYQRNFLPLVFPNPGSLPAVSLYKLCNNFLFMPYLDRANSFVNATLFSDFVVNQMTLPESIMAISSLLVDSANTRTFGIPSYGFSARSNANGIGIGGIGYHCSQFISIRTPPDQNGKTTLIESVFARLSIEEDTLFAGSILPLSNTFDPDTRTLYDNIISNIQTKNKQMDYPQRQDIQNEKYQKFIQDNQNPLFYRQRQIQKIISSL